MNNQQLAIKQLDRQLKEWRMVENKFGTPRIGWIKTLRTALSMSVEQFANRLALTRSRVNQLENAEAHNAITLRSLREAANALGCELIYAIVPKSDTTLEEMIHKQAEDIAEKHIASIAHTMSLESQTVNPDILQIQKDELIKNLTEHLNKKFWASIEKRNKKFNLRNNLIKNSKNEK